MLEEAIGFNVSKATSKTTSTSTATWGGGGRGNWEGEAEADISCALQLRLHGMLHVCWYVDVWVDVHVCVSVLWCSCVAVHAPCSMLHAPCLSVSFLGCSYSSSCWLLGFRSLGVQCSLQTSFLSSVIRVSSHLLTLHCCQWSHTVITNHTHVRHSRKWNVTHNTTTTTQTNDQTCTTATATARLDNTTQHNTNHNLRIPAPTTYNTYARAASTEQWLCGCMSMFECLLVDMLTCSSKTQNFILVQLLSIGPMIYMSWCAYYALFKG